MLVMVIKKLLPLKHIHTDAILYGYIIVARFLFTFCNISTILHEYAHNTIHIIFILQLDNYIKI
jgi:hypothetical protein